MTLYKYRSLTNIDRTLDILLNQRLYASQYVNLNDPMEGYFYHYGLSKSKLKSILRAKLSYRICSLSKSYKDIGLWTFYADEGRGCCIEVEPEAGEWIPHDIDYNIGIPVLDDVIKGRYDVQTIEKILCTKLKRWEYEQEVRYLKSVEKKEKHTFLKVKVKRVILGYNMEKGMKELMKKLIMDLNNSKESIESIEIKEMNRKNLTYKC